MDKTKCECAYEGCALKCTVTGEIDHHTAKSLRETIDAAIYLYRPAVVELRLENVGFMDSAGLGLILGRYAKIRELGGALTVIRPTEQVEKILRLAGVENMIKIEKGA